MTIIEQIKAEIERRIKKYATDVTMPLEVLGKVILELKGILSFLSTIESEKPLGEEYAIEIGKYTHTLRIGSQSDIDNLIRQEKQEQPSEGLKDEAVSYCFDNGLNISPRVATDFARHFYDLGCRRTAEKYDEIEYIRQRAEESVPKDLEEAAEKYFIKVPCSEEVKKSLIEIYKPGINAFIAGAKWQKGQMMKEAVDFTLEFTHQITLPRHDPGFGNIGDKVRVIVLPKED